MIKMNEGKPQTMTKEFLEDIACLPNLSQSRRGDRGVIVQVCDHALELERRFLEMGLVEGARFEVLHEGLFGRDPIAVKVDDMLVALRRHESANLIVRFDS
jgi:ferrous iron transport protein A